MKSYERHALSAVWPDMTGEEFEELKTDVSANGLFHPIKLFEGKVLDGWHRYRACKETGAKLLSEKFDGDAAAARAYAKGANGPRRNTTASQRALAYAEIANWVQAGRAANPAPGAELKPNKNNDLKNVTSAAKEARVSDRTMHQAKVVVEKGGEKLKAAVRAGEISLKKATKVVDLPKSEQLAAAKAKPAKPDDEPERPDWEPEEDEKLAAIEREIAESTERVMRADDKLAAAHVEIKRQGAEIATLKSSRDHYQSETGAAVRIVKARDRQIQKLERELASSREENEALRERIAIMEAVA
jgi:hypothetical protein